MAIDKRISLLALAILATVLAAALIAALTFGGGAKRTVASRSAAAFLEAQQKGEPVAEGGHGHGALAPGTAAQPAHGGHGTGAKKPEHAEQRSDAMPAHDMSGHGMPTSSPSAEPHAGHTTSQQKASGSPAEREGRRQEPAGGHAGMQHGDATAPRTTADTMAGARILPRPGPKAAEASPGQPAGTLRPDPLDQPVETSVAEAMRALELALEMGGGHGMQHGTSSYRQLDAGRDTPPPASPTPAARPREPTHPPHHSGDNGATR